jgi:membrane protein DedA with SNARE-associated domain
MSQDQLPGVFGDMQPLLEHYGYLAVGGFVLLEDFGVPVPGEAIMIAAAIFAGTGQMNIAVVIVVAALGAIIGDNIGFAVGHFGGRPLVERFGRYIFLTPERLDRAEDYFNRHGGKIVVIARFVEGLRQVNGILAGTVGMHWLKFLAFNALGAVLWVCWWSLLGHFAGENISEIYAGFERYKWYVIGTAAVIVIAVVVHRIRRRRALTPETP